MSLGVWLTGFPLVLKRLRRPLFYRAVGLSTLLTNSTVLPLSSRHHILRECTHLALNPQNSLLWRLRSASLQLGYFRYRLHELRPTRVEGRQPHRRSFPARPLFISSILSWTLIIPPKPRDLISQSPSSPLSSLRLPSPGSPLIFSLPAISTQQSPRPGHYLVLRSEIGLQGRHPLPLTRDPPVPIFRPVVQPPRSRSPPRSEASR